MFHVATLAQVKRETAAEQYKDIKKTASPYQRLQSLFSDTQIMN